VCCVKFYLNCITSYLVKVFEKCRFRVSLILTEFKIGKLIKKNIDSINFRFVFQPKALLPNPSLKTTTTTMAAINLNQTAKKFFMSTRFDDVCKHLRGAFRNRALSSFRLCCRAWYEKSWATPTIGDATFSQGKKTWVVGLTVFLVFRSLTIIMLPLFYCL